jgi:hypothetical protein
MAEFMRRILKLFQNLDKEVTSIDDNLKELLQIAKKISNIEETFSILAQTTSISGKLDKFCLLKAMIMDTFDKIEFDRIEKQPQEEIESSNSTNSKEQTSIEEGKDRYDILSLRPNYQQDKDKNKAKLPTSPPKNISAQEDLHYSKMQELYVLTSTEDRHIDYSGIYPRIKYIPGSNPEEIRYWYDFGAVNTIYTAPSNFAEISLLPRWIYDGVKDCYFNNPMITAKDILVLKFLSAVLDFFQEENYQAYHFIQLWKAEAYFLTSPVPAKEFLRFTEKDIHYRRAIGMHVVIQGIEAAFKKGFHSYGGKKMFSSIMISSAKATPPSVTRYLQSKIELIETGKIKSSPQAQDRFCQLRRHIKDTCLATLHRKLKKKKI